MVVELDAQEATAGAVVGVVTTAMVAVVEVPIVSEGADPSGTVPPRGAEFEGEAEVEVAAASAVAVVEGADSRTATLD